MAEPASPTGLNATSASVLGLLAIEDWPRPWTSYELAKQAGRSLHWFWPRAERQFISVPKKLVELGYAEAHDHPTGRRAGTRYSVTPSGRAALRTWLDEPGASVRIEGEEIIRVFLADQGDIDQLRATLRRVAAGVAEDRRRLGRITAEMDSGGTSKRASVNALSLRLVSDLQATVQQWADWALEETADWADPRAPWTGAKVIFDDVVAGGGPRPSDR